MEKTNRKNRREERPAGAGNGERRPYREKKNGFERSPKHYEKSAKEERPRRQPAEDGSVGNGAVIGRNAVRELLRSGRAVDKILVQSGEREGALVPLVGEAIARGIPVVETERRKMDAVSGFAPHQGIIALAAEKEYCEIEDILAVAKERGEKPLVVVADGISDPYNLGAVIRCAEGCGAHGVIIPKRHAAGLTPLVSKASAGAIEHMAIAKVPNVSAAIETLKEAGLWIFAAEANGDDFRKTDMSVPAALVLGSEGEGIAAGVRAHCDYVVSIPMYGKVNSFNVSTAAAVLLCEIAHQQRN